MPDPFNHISHRARERGGGTGGRSLRDTMMDEAAQFAREVRSARAEGQATQSSKRAWWKRLGRKSSEQATISEE